MPPEIVQVFHLHNGRFAWEVTFQDEGLDQSGHADSFDGAWACVREAIENAKRPS